MKTTQIIVRRTQWRKWGIDGELYIGGRKICDTVEHPYLSKKPGSYVVTRGQNTFVHGDGALSATKGEIVVGQYLLSGVVTKSVLTHWKLYERIRKAWRRGKEVKLLILEEY